MADLSTAVVEEARARTLPLPTVLWIELSSRCPYDCVFCSRRLLRGRGEHMPIDLYRRIVGQLAAPEILRLNYSGESIHHPDLPEAVALAAATGAQVELVSVPAAVRPADLETVVRAGLNRLSVSLHTLEPDAFRAIYRFGELGRLLDNLHALAAMPAAHRRDGRHVFTLDLAFVAMERNLDQLPRVAALARELGVPALGVHPVIRRVELPERFADELDDRGRLRDGFRLRLADAVAGVRAAHPELAVSVSTPELGTAPPRVDAEPVAWPGPPPPGTRIIDCDQSPWETLHVLADGTAVVCEVRDRVPIGSLREQSLAEIWHGPVMRAFRETYLAGADAACRGCPYKRVAAPAPPPRRIGAAAAGPHLLFGWYASEGDVRWAKPESAFRLAGRHRPRRLRLRGLLPGGVDMPNTLTISVAGKVIGVVCGAGAALEPFDVRLPLAEAGDSHEVIVHCRVSRPWVPAARGASCDTRRLGFALVEAALR